MNQLNLHGTIGVGQNTSANIAAQIDAMDDSEKLRISVDSPGGDVIQGFSIQSKLQAYAGQKVFVVESYAGSIASYILTAATGEDDRIEITANGMVMIHNPSIEVDGDDEVLRKKADLVAKVKTEMINGYSELSGKSEAEMAAIMSEEVYLNADEALDAGFVTAVQKRKVATPALAALDKKLRPKASDEKPIPPTPAPTEKPMAEATIDEIQAAFPQASDSFVLGCLKAKMTMTDVTAKAVSETAEENKKLREQIKALEEANAKLKAEGDHARAESEDDEPEANDEENVEAMDDEESVEAMDEEMADAPSAHAKAQLKANAPKRQKAGSGLTAGVKMGAAKKEWNEAIQAHVSTGMPKARAVMLVAKEQPELRDRLIAEANGQ